MMFVAIVCNIGLKFLLSPPDSFFALFFCGFVSVEVVGGACPHIYIVVSLFSSD